MLTNAKEEKSGQNMLLFLLTVSIMAVSMLTSFEPLLANVPINVCLPLAVMLGCKMVFFEKLKLTTLVILRAAIVLAVFNVLPRSWYVNIVLIFLVINILEATLTDFKRKKWWNGVSGLVLGLSVWFLRGEWIDLTGAYPFAHIYEANAAAVWGTIAWIAAYTIWNWIFVTNEFSPAIAKLHVGILAAPILSSLLLWNPGYWLVFRANSLTFGGCVQISQKEKLETALKCDGFGKFVAATQKKIPQIIFMLINLVLIALSGILK